MSSVLNIVLATTGGAAVINALGGVQSLLGGIAAAATSTTAALAGIDNALDFGGQLADLSARTGQTARDLVVLRRAFDTSGVGAENTAPMIGLLQKAIAGLNEEGGKTDAVFKRIGLSADALKSMPALDQVAALTRAFEAIKDPSERAALAMQLFGRNGAQMLQLLGDSSALTTAQREVGRLAVRAAENAAKFDEVGDRLSLAKLRLMEFYVVAAEKAIPALERMADLIDSFNPSAVGAVLGNALAIASAIGGAALVKKLDTFVLDWATRQGSPIGQTFAARFLAPLTGSLARILPIGLAAVIAKEVLVGIANGYFEWKNQKLEAANAGFDAVSKIQGRAKNVRSDADIAAVIADAKTLRDATVAASNEADGLWPDEQQMASYRQQIEALRDIAANLGGAWGKAQVAQNKLLDEATAHAKRLGEAKTFLASDDAKKLRQEIAADRDERADPAERLASLRIYLSLQERVLAAARVEAAAGRDDALNQQQVLNATVERERTLKSIADVEQKLARETADKAQANLDLQLRLISARRAAVEGDFTRTDASKFGDRARLIEQEIAAQKRYIEVLQARHQATTDQGARETLGGQIRTGMGTLSDLQNQQAQLGPDPNSYLQQFEAASVQVYNNIGTLAQQAARGVTQMWGAAANTLQQGLYGLITRSGQGLKGLALSFGQSMLQTFTQMVADYAVKKAAMFAIDVLFAGKSLALSLASAAKSLVAWIPSAIAASISSFGTAAAIGVAAVIGGLAAFGGFEDGDYTGGTRGKIAGFVHGEEFVFSAPAVDALGVDTLRGVHEAALAGDAVGAAAAFGGGGGGGAAAGGAQPQATNITVITVASEREATRIARNSRARGDVVRIVSEEFGLPSRRA